MINFIGELSGTDEGKIIIVNMWDSVDTKLVDSTFLKKFLGACAALRAANAAKSALSIFQEVTFRVDPTGSPIFLRKSTQVRPLAKGTAWANTVTWSSWWRFHHDSAKTSGKIPIPRINHALNRAQLPTAETYLRQVVALPNWWKATGSLGLPLPTPSNCWLSNDDFLPASVPSAKGLATDARDELGLIDTTHGSMLVRYRFAADSGMTGAGNDVARPVFSDGGNTRFRVHATSKMAKAYAARGWGSTAHLGKISKSKTGDVSGKPELVSRALTIAGLSDLSVTLLGEVAETRGTTAVDNHVVFLRHLLRRRKLETVKQKLIRLCA